jgi:hypothetical protein
MFLILLAYAGCAAAAKPELLRKFPADSMEGVLTQTGVSFDSGTSTDGNGSLKIETSQPTTVRLFEVRDVTIENARLIFKARLKALNVTGQAYLEMWCVFPGLGEFFSRGLDSALTGTVDWTSQETPFFLQKGQAPGLIKLNVVVNGAGTVWIDDIQLTKGPL